MPTILNIETSTEPCSAALTAEGAILCHYEEFKPMAHATALSGFIKECLDHLRRHDMALDAVAVSIGPGSYTGLRIGLSEAKGLAYAMKVPLIGVPTLELLTVATMFSVHDLDPDTLFAPMIDARRMEVYTAVYNLALEPIMEPRPLVLDDTSYSHFLERGPVCFFGNGSDKARQVISSPNARFIPDIKPLAADMLALSDRAFRQGRFLDMAYATPLYLKEFQATRPKPLL